MNFQQRFEAIRGDMSKEGIDLLLGFHDGTHFGGSVNALMMLSGFRSMGDAVAMVDREGSAGMLVAPAWEAGRAAECAPHMKVTGVADTLAALKDELARRRVPLARVGLAGLSVLPWEQAKRITALFENKAKTADQIIVRHAGAKTEEEVGNARHATLIAEKGYARMLELARPGVREDDLAVDLRWYMKTLGAEDNFLMLNAGPHNKAVQPCSSRKMAPGDLLLTELSPIYKGQMTQICRTIVMGRATPEQKRCYQILIDGYENGEKAAKPGVPMAKVCDAVDEVIDGAGYAEYGRPPYLRLRRRGHGLGFGCDLPGDVGPDNDIILEPGMVFVLHPNQYLPETGYMMCGEPLLITATGSEALSRTKAVLGEVAL